VDPKYSSYDKAFSDYIQTRSDAPASLIFNTYVTSTITSIPAWFSAMPNDVKEYAQSLADEQLKIAESVVKEGAAPKATGAVGMVGAGMAAVAAGAAILL
jgi:hypothetical protein